MAFKATICTICQIGSGLGRGNPGHPVDGKIHKFNGRDSGGNPLPLSFRRSISRYIRHTTTISSRLAQFRKVLLKHGDPRFPYWPSHVRLNDTNFVLSWWKRVSLTAPPSENCAGGCAFLSHEPRFDNPRASFSRLIL